uniref:Protein kinase domain-containing protein n=1 Tax=Chenopodium quinoa TaxID=63459 RepID=A0A803L505_CHEQI
MLRRQSAAEECVPWLGCGVDWEGEERALAARSAPTVAPADVVPLSNSEYAPYTACSIPFSCGQFQNVGYPFWGDNRPNLCGVPEFKVICGNDSEVYMNVFQNNIMKLQVLSINQSSHTIAFSLSNLFNSCYLQNTSYVSLLSTAMKPILDVDDRNISLIYGCNNSCNSRYYSTTFSFSNGDGTSCTAYYFGNPSIGCEVPSSCPRTGGDTAYHFHNYLSGIIRSCSCKSNVTIPISKRGLDELSSRNVSLVNDLKRCGSSGSLAENQFVCHCADGPHPLVCSESGAAASLVGTMMLVALIICLYKRRKTSKFSLLWSRRTIGDQNVAAFLQSYGSLAQKGYTYADIKKITNSFKDKLCEGGYGSVYKGRLHNGRFVAVKKLKVLKGDGKDFINEVLSISMTNHVNVVTLLGFCFEGYKRALVFEFLPNGSLEKFIYGKEIRQPLQWETMFNIAIGIARGLDYLHRGCNTRILHFDIKPHNIRLDDEFHPKISDFGLARLCPPKKSLISMSEARGTIGYIAPEVFCRNLGGASHKSDVYSYGMMLIDLVCGRKVPTNEVQHDNSELYFPEWIYSRFEPVQEAAVDGIEDNDINELERKMILVGLWCIQTYPSNRPPMNRVVEMLEGPLESLQMPPKPHSSSPASRAG